MCRSDTVVPRAYDRRAVEVLGEFARLNFPREWPPERRAQVRAEYRAAKKKARKPKGNAKKEKAKDKSGKAKAGRRTREKTRPR